MKKFAAAGGLLFVTVALCVGEEFRAVITKVDGDKVTFQKVTGGGKGKKAERGEAMTLTAASDVKVVKGTFNKDTKKAEDGDAIDKGLKNEMFSKEVNCTIVTDDAGKTITKIRTRGERKKKTDVE
ncbi:MAG: hypothetical protein U0793_26055 [Gemmataceae bacterium]